MVHLKSITHKPALLGVVCFCSLFNVTATDVKPDELAGKALQKKRTTITSFSNMLPDAFASHIHSHISKTQNKMPKDTCSSFCLQERSVGMISYADLLGVSSG